MRVLTTRGARAIARAGAVACLVSGPGCGLESEWFQAMTDQGAEVLPEPSPTVVSGVVEGMAGASVDFVAQGGVLADRGTVVDDDGAFESTFDGTEGYVGVMVWAASGDRVRLSLMAELPRQPTVFHDTQMLALGQVAPAMSPVRVESTAATLVAAQLAKGLGLSLDGLPVETLEDALDRLAGALADQATDAFDAVVAMVAALDEAAASSATGATVYTPDGFTPGASALNPAWLAEVGVDYDGDGMDDGDGAAFDQALTAAAAVTFEGAICYERDRIPVVFMVDLGGDVLNAECKVQDHYKWSSNSPGKSVFFTGGVHDEQPVCSDERPDHCLTEAQVDEVNQAIGNWVPNLMEMFDDGTHGDRVPNDSVYTIAFELPYIPTEDSPDGGGVRLGYKYTYGLPGAGWTDAEEWPGNQRLLEIEDVNGDRVVARYDVFGEETANKDKANLLKPKFGGCGTVHWEGQRDELDPDRECAWDTRENMVDSDGDCELDAWANPFPTQPLTLPCE